MSGKTTEKMTMISHRIVILDIRLTSFFLLFIFNREVYSFNRLMNTFIHFIESLTLTITHY